MLPDTLQTQLNHTDPAQRLATLDAWLLEQADYHKLFDARMLAVKHRMALPISKPTSFDDVPDDQRAEFEKAYVSTAREIGHLLLKAGDLAGAHIYFHTIRETAPLFEAIEQLPVPTTYSPESEAFIRVAFQHGVHPACGVEAMLEVHGVCNAITSLDQQFGQLTTEMRARCAAILVRRLHRDLLQNVRRDVAKRLPMSSTVSTLRETIAGKEWLFADSAYHIDVSHLHSTVRFARSLQLGAPELALAQDLAVYGGQLAASLRYAGEPPFVDYYQAHEHYFRVLQLGSAADCQAELAYFQQQLTSQDDDRDQVLCAYVLVDLLVRLKDLSAAVEVARQYLVQGDSEFHQPFAELCLDAKAYKTLAECAVEWDDPVTLAMALTAQSQQA
jgi:hypothetical protein